MSILRASAIFTAALLIAPALSGCTVGVVDQSPSPNAPTHGTPRASDASASDASATDDERQQLIAEAAVVRRCDGELIIVDDGVAVQVQGSCDRLILNSTGSRVVADEVGYLSVIGDENLVVTGPVDELLVNGQDNTVRWQGDAPQVTDVGEANTLRAG